MRAPTAAKPGVAYPVRLAFTNARHQGRVPRRVVAKAETDNPFAKIGTQLVKAGSQLTERLTGSGKVSRRGASNDKVVFIAGATGRLGARIVKQALQAGYRVRAGCRDVEKGEKIISTAQDYELLSPSERKRLTVVEFSLFDEDTFARAIGNAGIVVSALGAPESKPFDVSGPKLVDGEGSINLINAARDLGVSRFIMVTSLGTTKFGWPASALNLFWGVLYWKAQAEKALVRSGMAYTIVRPGGMERPQDDYQETHPTVLAPRDTYFGNQISRLQVVELIGACLLNPELSGNKTLEAVALDDAPRRDLEDLLADVDAEISMDEMREKQAAIGEARTRAAALEREAERLEEQLAAAEETKVNAEQAFSAARTELQDVRGQSSADLRAADQATGQLDSLREQLDAARRQEEAAKAVFTAQRTAGRSGDVLSRNELRDIQQPILNPPTEDDEEEETAGGSQGARGGFLGSLFGGTAQATVEDAAEEVEEEVAEAPRKASRGFGGLFSRAKETASDIEDELEGAAEEAAPQATQQARRGFGGLFGGAKDAAEEAEEKVEKAAPQVKKAAPQVKKAARQAQSKAEDVVEDVQETAQQTTKGGGLFGMFQQDTVYADDADAAPPSEVQVERAVTKRGMGAPKRRKGGASQLQSQAKQAASSAQDAAKGAAKEAEKQAPQTAKKVEKAAEEAPKEAGNFFSGLFGNLSKAAEDMQGPAASAAEGVKEGANKAADSAQSAAKQAASKAEDAAPSKPAAEAGKKRGGNKAASDRRAAAIGDAIKNFESAADGTAKEASKAVSKGAQAVEKGAKEAGSEAKSAATAAKSEASASSMNGATPGAGGQEGAQKWIATWRKKQKA